MVHYENKGSLEEISMEQVETRGLVATGSPVTLEDGEGTSVNESYFDISIRGIPEDAVAFVSADSGGYTVGHTFLAIQFYRESSNK